MGIPAMSVLSKEFVKSRIKAYEDGVPVNPTGDTVEMAFPVFGVDPVGGDWKSAEWETASGTYFARCLVGPGGTVALPVGLYDVYVRINNAAEVPVLYSGRIAIE